MCLAIPGKVTKRDKDTVKLDVLGEKKEAKIFGIDADVGDYVLVTAGIVTQKLKRKEAEQTIKILKGA